MPYRRRHNPSALGASETLKAVSLDPNYAKAYAGLGLCHRDLKKVDDAVDYYRALGWQVHDQLQLGPLFVTVMAIDLVSSHSKERSHGG